MSQFENISVVSPWLLLLSVFPISWYVYKYYFRITSDGTYTIFSTDPLEDLSTWKTKLSFLPDLLRLLSMLLFVLALARPQLVFTEEKVNAEGIDIMLAIDLSSSMLAQDFNPNRLEVSKKEAESFIDKRPYDRIGLSVFSGEAFTQCPLTTDHLILKDYLRSLQVGALADGTAIGMGLATAMNRLKDSEAVSKIVILLTDGVNNSGYIDPNTAAEIAREFGVKVYTIGVGTDGSAMTPVNRQSNGEFLYRMSRVEIDEQLLQKISADTGGKYYRARDKNDLEKIYEEIDKLEKTEIETTAFKRYQDEFRFFLSIGLILLVLELILRNTILKVLS